MQPLILASKSPRRVSLLKDAAVPCHPLPPDLDDAHLAHSASPPEHWVAALAYLKARRVADANPDRAVLGADTVVIKHRAVIGQPQDHHAARRTIEALRQGHHTVATGVALLLPNTPRLLFTDTARVDVGPISDQQIDDYLRSGHWQGKAGAYNLAERQAAGWPLQSTGDPATVMGLPMQRLLPILRRLALAPPIADTETAPTSKGEP